MDGPLVSCFSPSCAAIDARCSWRDFWIFTSTNHPLLSVLLVDALHPFRKIERMFHGIVTVLYRLVLFCPLCMRPRPPTATPYASPCSVAVGHVSTAFSIEHGDGVCSDETGVLCVLGIPCFITAASHC